MRHSLIHFQILQPVLTLKPICTKKKAGIIAMCKSQTSKQTEYVCWFVYGLLTQYFDKNVFKIVSSFIAFHKWADQYAKAIISRNKHWIKTHIYAVSSKSLLHLISWIKSSSIFFCFMISLTDYKYWSNLKESWYPSNVK